jgi:hypothetical protein
VIGKGYKDKGRVPMRSPGGDGMLPFLESKTVLLDGKPSL